MKQTGIYGIKCKASGKYYIGQSIKMKNRLCNHRSVLRAGKHFNTHLQKAYSKYGEEEFEFFEIEVCGEDKLCEREQYWVAYYNSSDPEYGYNGTIGGEKGTIWTPESLIRLSEGHKGKKCHTEEFKRKLAERNKNRVWTEESKEKLRNHRLGSVMPEEQKLAIRNGVLGLKKSEACKEKFRQAKLGLKKGVDGKMYRPSIDVDGGVEVKTSV